MITVSINQRATSDSGPAQPLEYAAFDSDYGRLSLAFSGRTARFSDLDLSAEDFEQKCYERIGERPVPSSEVPAVLGRAVRDVLDRRGRFRGTVDLSSVTPLQERALREVMTVRRGEIRSYSWIARAIGAPLAARAVGDAMASNPIPVLVPCHRAVRTDYTLVNYGAGGPSKKRAILLLEGVDVDALARRARQGKRFNGCTTTRIFCLPFCYAGRRVKPHNAVTFSSPSQAIESGYRPCKLCCPA
ncbi:MAG: methylated-DNA--[protein]-cysteine S-methyltransferase [Chloroflexota bacterium]